MDPVGPVRIVLNGAEVEFPRGATVADVVDSLQRGRSGLAVAVGDDVVPRTAWESRRLREADRVEVLTAVQGG
jgi:sulfur carrier protein